ncbi:MAG: hypothetical protein LBI95_03810 [Holosporales bacterium]|jgi:hypothetical protein|nr:hypothetical protein [Holosporales bacterium]
MTPISEISIASLVVFVSGVISVFALLLSKISLLLKDKGYNADSGYYECGFKTQILEFTYLNGNEFAISLYLILELAVMWLLLYCFLDLEINEQFEKMLIRTSSVFIMMSTLISARSIFKIGRS